MFIPAEFRNSLTARGLFCCVPKEESDMDVGASHFSNDCARFCHDSGGELEQIQFLLGHVSVQTTERYIGCKQRLRVAVNDRLGIEPGGVGFTPQLDA